MEVRPDGDARTSVHFHCLVRRQAGLHSKGCVDNHCDCGVDAVRARHGARHGGLFLDCRHGKDVPGVPAPGQLFQAQHDGRNGGTVVHGFARHVAARKRHEAAAHRHHVTNVNRRLHVIARKPDVDEELFKGDGLLPLRRIREVRGDAHHQAGQLTGAMNHHFLAEEHPRVETADLGDLEEAFFDPGHHERNLVHVPGEHDGGSVSRGALSPSQGNEVPHGVDPHLVSELHEALPHYLADLGLVP